MANESIRVIVAGPRGKMGSEALRLIERTKHFQLVAALDSKNNGKKVADLEGAPMLDAPVYDEPARCLQDTHADVLIDFTTPEIGSFHTELALQHGVRPVVGTSGFSEEKVKELSRLAEENQLGTIIAPNFAMGAVLMMKFSQLAAKYYPDAEIIEQHHDGKLDAPSGTAIKTAEMMSVSRDENRQDPTEARETLEGARGGKLDGTHIHSVRLPGLIAHQEVLFGGEHETLKIRHDSFHRQSFMSGVKLAVETVMGLHVLVYGLDQILE